MALKPDGTRFLKNTHRNLIIQLNIKDEIGLVYLELMEEEDQQKFEKINRVIIYIYIYIYIYI